MGVVSPNQLEDWVGCGRCRGGFVFWTLHYFGGHLWVIHSEWGFDLSCFGFSFFFFFLKTFGPMSSLESKFETDLKLSSSIARLTKPSLFEYFLTKVRSAWPALMSKFLIEQKSIFCRHFLV